MARLWRNGPSTREGKYPVLLRRDGTVPGFEWFVLGSRDPASIAALRAYADETKTRGWDPAYTTDLYALAESWLRSQGAERLDRIERAQATRYSDDPRNNYLSELPKPADPDGPKHRTDDPDVLAFPEGLAAYRAPAEAMARAIEVLLDPVQGAIEALGGEENEHVLELRTALQAWKDRTRNRARPVGRSA